MSKPIILVTGKNGQLGSELQSIAADHPAYEFVFADSQELDISDKNTVDEYFDRYNPAVCINAAAYTAVDKAETEKERAIAVNSTAVGFLAEASRKHNTRLIHVSTDYVFNGEASEPYKEDHPVSPVNFYGETKLKGEDAAIANNPSSIIVRTSWVYSTYGNNFVKTMIRLMKERESINVVMDQIGSPTYAADLAAALMHIATSESSHCGIYHFSNSGEISWFHFASAIKELIGSKCLVNPIPTSGFPTPAKRPNYSVLGKEKIRADFGLELKDWRESLEACISSF